MANNVGRLKSVANAPLIDEFKTFLLRGNVIDLAVAVVIGAAFGAVVSAFTDSFITPLIAAIGGQPDYSDIGFHINGAWFGVGSFLNALIAFLITAAVIFFFVVKPMNMLVARARTEPPADPTTKKCPYCINEVPVEATRCGFCTSELPLEPATALA
ncbi:MAG: large conductance mechanosensitive channel protein MscL [Thermomicrobiales bacterium]|jgi:large conductance mechanosensitive channel